MRKRINILNGDCAVEPFKASSFPGEILVWREIYTEGPLEAGGTIEPFRRIRAHYLAPNVTEWSEAQILHGLERMDAAVLSLAEKDSLRIWTDACMFDQAMMTRVLFLTASLPEERRPEVELFADDGVCSSAEFFYHLFACGGVLSNTEIVEGARGWEFFRTRCVPERIPARFRFLREALIRHAAERPDESGLGLTQRRILELARTKISPPELFRRLGAQEKHPWLGDSGCWRLIDELAEAGRLQVRDAKGNALNLHLASADLVAEAEIVVRT